MLTVATTQVMVSTCATRRMDDDEAKLECRGPGPSLLVHVPGPGSASVLLVVDTIDDDAPPLDRLSFIFHYSCGLPVTSPSSLFLHDPLFTQCTWSNHISRYSLESIRSLSHLIN